MPSMPARLAQADGMTPERPELRKQRMDWERRWERASLEERERMIAEYHAAERRLRGKG
jgi:hypothetical protein